MHAGCIRNNAVTKICSMILNTEIGGLQKGIERQSDLFYFFAPTNNTHSYYTIHFHVLLSPFINCTRYLINQQIGLNAAYQQLDHCQNMYNITIKKVVVKQMYFNWLFKCLFHVINQSEMVLVPNGLGDHNLFYYSIHPTKVTMETSNKKQNKNIRVIKTWRHSKLILQFALQFIIFVLWFS